MPSCLREPEKMKGRRNDAVGAAARLSDTLPRCHPERSREAAQPKDLLCPNLAPGARSFDSLRSLRMTGDGGRLLPLHRGG